MNRSVRNSRILPVQNRQSVHLQRALDIRQDTALAVKHFLVEDAPLRIRFRIELAEFQLEARSFEQLPIIVDRRRISG